MTNPDFAGAEEEVKPADLDWLRGAAQSLAFGPTTYMLLQPYVDEIEALRAALRRYGDHRDTCHALENGLMGNHCSCGFSAALGRAR